RTLVLWKISAHVRDRCAENALTNATNLPCAYLLGETSFARLPDSRINPPVLPIYTEERKKIFPPASILIDEFARAVDCAAEDPPFQAITHNKTLRTPQNPTRVWPGQKNYEAQKHLIVLTVAPCQDANKICISATRVVPYL